MFDVAERTIAHLHLNVALLHERIRLLEARVEAMVGESKKPETPCSSAAKEKT